MNPAALEALRRGNEFRSSLGHALGRSLRAADELRGRGLDPMAFHPDDWERVLRGETPPRRHPKSGVIVEPIPANARPDDGVLFPGLSHADALERQVPETPMLVTDLIEAGTLGTITALPELHKTFLATEIALKVAAGAGQVLGRFDVVRRGPVGYWWQDDSEANELRRLQEYSNRHGFPRDTPIRWHLNEGLRLPEHVDYLRGEVEDEGQALVVLDSLYNFLPAGTLKDEEVAGVLRQLKEHVADATGCTICLVDHAPWPTEGNRGQRRAYGSVFKAAAIRWGIYLDRDSQSLWIGAHGNNIVGLNRTGARFDGEALELRLVDEDDKRDYVDEIKAFLLKRPESSKTQVSTALEASKERVSKALEANPSIFENRGTDKAGKWAVRAAETAGTACSGPGEGEAVREDVSPRRGELPGPPASQVVREEPDRLERLKRR